MENAMNAEHIMPSLNVRDPLHVKKMEEIITDTIDFIKTIFENDSSGHDYFHSLRVYKTALKIAQEENANTDIVALAALLHDVDDRKLSPQTYENKDNAVRFLKDKNVSDESISQICRIIDEVSFNGNDSVAPSTIEGKCVQDADRIDALGAVGIARTFAYGGSHNRIMYNPEIEPMLGMTKEEYQNHISTSINHFYEKLFLLKGLMNTKCGKAIAEKREEYMKKFVEEFIIEWNGKDI